MNPYFVIIPEGHQFGMVFTIINGQWYSVAHNGNKTKVEFVTMNPIMEGWLSGLKHLTANEEEVTLP